MEFTQNTGIMEKPILRDSLKMGKEWDYGEKLVQMANQNKTPRT